MSKTSLKPCNEWPVLTDEELTEKMITRPRWELFRDNSANVPKLKTKFITENFLEAMNYLQSAAIIAERQGHHPDFHLTGWNNVEVVVYTHSLGGLTDNDFNLVDCLDKEISIKLLKKFADNHPEF